jgi:chromosome segregation ATPase
MINNLTIKNFQSHQDTNLEFDKGLNIIVGSSDSGKSAIIRALNWIINNKPSGDSFISNWADKSDVEIKVDSDEIIKRSKSKKGINSYSISQSFFKAFGKEVPKEIKGIINFTELNCQFQMDAPFLLSNTAGEVGRYLNEIVDLDIIDSGLSNIESEKRKANNEFSRLTDEKERLDRELSRYSNIEKLEINIQKLEGLNIEIDKINSDLDNLDSLIDDIINVQFEMASLKNLDYLSRDISELEKIQKDMEKDGNDRKALIDVLESYDFFTSDIKEFEKYIRKVEDFIKKNMPKICPLCDQAIK